MNKLHKTILAILLLMAATGCGKEKYVKPMSDAAYATADRACGVFRLVSIDWTGRPVDLDGDGVAQASLLEECLAGKHSGMSSYDRVVEWTVQPLYSYSETPILELFPFFHGDFTPGVESSAYYSLNLIFGKMRVFEDGTLDVTMYDYPEGIGGKMTNEEGAIRDITVTLEPDGDFLVAGTTSFRDERTGETVRGRATHRYHCVSTKEKKK
jgi:hypothetical protein